MDLQKLQFIRDDVLKKDIPSQQMSNDFAGVYLHSNSPFVLKEHIASFHSFRVFSQYQYPIYLFISLDAITPDVETIVNLYQPVKVVTIQRLKTIIDFNNFCINNLLYLIDVNHENLLFFQSDGFIIKEGWEEKCSDYSWLGAAWKDSIKVIENTFNFPEVIGFNGGCNFRRKSKCYQVNDLVDKYGGQQKIVKGLQINEKIPRQQSGYFLAEDLYFSYFGFGAGIFEPVSLNYIDTFAKEPLTLAEYNKEIKPVHLFHRIDE